jgi:hypothetical protein
MADRMDAFIGDNPTLQAKDRPNKLQKSKKKPPQKKREEDIYLFKVCDQEYCDCSNRACKKGMTCQERYALNGSLYLCIKDVK